MFAVRFLLGTALEGLLPAGPGSPRPRGTRTVQPPEPQSGVKGSKGTLQQAFRDKAWRRDGSAPPGDAASGCSLRRMLAPGVSRGAGSTAKRTQARLQTPSSASSPDGGRQPHTESTWGAAESADPEAQRADRLRRSSYKPRRAARSAAPVPGGWMGDLTP
ncbi:hypothetical protein NDU88_002109 [Pleurodeles waltl]|uniref:Uncharacterized protein n=1 Tax=Pleurodeles waltl TaxID=8319 RepID=A0AAV7TJP0_PLEWA|nr:hypothetical protein NDU88_002109 [Pleurodeles waltl]